jgi:hypothetical protein
MSLEKGNVDYSKYNWFDVLTYYQNIKKLYRLTSHDIVRQLCDDIGIPFCYGIVSRLSKNYTTPPSNKIGTTGRDIWYVLTYGMIRKKSNWLPSTATYDEKLREKILDGFFTGYHVNTLTENPGERPEVTVCIMNKQFMIQDPDQPTKLMLEEMLEIDGIVPIVVEISQGYYL